MVKTSVLNDALNAINNAEKTGKRQVMIRPSSKVIVKFLTVMQKHGKSHFTLSCSVQRKRRIVKAEIGGRLYKQHTGLITRQWSQTSTTNAL